ncbi:DUF4010 domain-containing protein [Sphingomonas histidinilytica]|uniref:Uncharacterized membrane protein, DUF4010 family n=1 Tax=Rhizorhabdus histidinilytica TaxID=439228 RepID=A0A1T5D1G7_9SPHN|nr:DUF4010 domain-containing protein [Rhizorhabdus histidinilytica]MBO9376389.1 DUF4010 domain-containing protein [Rhizorhabdus histidinilytica]SKB65477.1 Uncharacterized membrane protein, DUF4010 family [Rhizorhabdus histidinilytica]
MTYRSLWDSRISEDRPLGDSPRVTPFREGHLSTAIVPPALINLGYAGAAGLLIGLERGWTLREGAQGTRVAGVRTFTLLGLGGGAAALLPIPLAATLLGIFGLSLLAGYVRHSARSDRNSITATVAGVLTLALGAIATGGAPTISIAGAAIATIILASREPLHRWLRGLREPELRAGARFAVIAFVLLPLAPDMAMGPFDAWNPHKLWWIVVLVSGLSFLGYLFHARAAGRRGVVVTALAAAIVSSTVATATLARRLDATPGSSLFGRGILAANIVMLARILAIVAIFLPAIIAHLALLLAPALGASLFGALLGARRTDMAVAPDVETSIPIGNPLDLGAALGLAAVVAAASLIGHWILDRFGDLTLGIVLALVGLFDVDAAVFTIAGLPIGSITPTTAATALAMPVLLNMVAKAVLTISLAPGRAGLGTALWLCGSAALSGAALVALM